MADTTEEKTDDVEAPAEAVTEAPESESTDESQARVSRVELEDLGAPGPAGMGAPAENLGRVLDVNVALTARVGIVRKTVSDIIDLTPGAIVDLERSAGEPIDLVIGDKLIARGEIVVVDDHYGVRVVEVLQD